MRIYKYPIEITDVQDIELPMDAQLLTFQFQNETPCLWAMVNTGLMKVKRRIRIYGTGHPIVNPGKYVGTAQQFGGQLVWHLFDQGEVDE